VQSKKVATIGYIAFINAFDSWLCLHKGLVPIRSESMTILLCAQKTSWSGLICLTDQHHNAPVFSSGVETFFAQY